MAILTRKPRSKSPDDGIPPHATGAPRRLPSWPGETVVNEHPFWQPIADDIPARRLPPEDRNLLTAYPDAPPMAPHAFLAALALSAAIRRGCRILTASAEFEVVVGQNFAMLADQDHYGVTS